MLWQPSCSREQVKRDGCRRKRQAEQSECCIISPLLEQEQDERAAKLWAGDGGAAWLASRLLNKQR